MVNSSRGVISFKSVSYLWRIVILVMRDFSMNVMVRMI